MPGAFFEPLGLPLGFLAGGSAGGGTGESSLGPSRMSSSLSIGAALTGVVTYEGLTFSRNLNSENSKSRFLLNRNKLKVTLGPNLKVGSAIIY